MTTSNDEIIRAARKQLGNQYAYLDSEGHYSALLHDGTPISDFKASLSKIVDALKATRSDAELEHHVNELLNWSWLNRFTIWPTNPPSSPMQVIDARTLIEVLDYRVIDMAGVEQMVERGTTVEVAGIIDNSSRSVWISSQLPETTRRLSIAHELAHVMLDSHVQLTMHRDKPLNAINNSRPPRERRADKFAAFYSMPRKLVQQQVFTKFGCAKVELNDLTWHYLTDRDIAYFENSAKFKTPREAFASTIAQITCFGGSQFYSLAEEFGVSIQAMAIRLIELELVVVQ